MPPLGDCLQIELDDKDKREIAEAVFEMLKPLVTYSDERDNNDNVFTKKTLSQYLNLSLSTIDKLVMNKQIPYFKIQLGQSGGVRFRKQDIDRWITRHTIPQITFFRTNLKRMGS